MTEVDIKIIKRTQETLGKLIKKPVLTEKLLQRPPFRFLHDICTAVNNQECVAHVLRGNEKDNTKANNTIKKPGPENDQLKGKVNVTPNSMDPERRLYPQENNLSLEKANTSENRLSIDDDDKSFYSVKNSSGLVNSEKCDTTKKNRLSQDSGSVGGNRCDFQKPEKLQKEVVVSLPSSSTIPHQPRHHRPASAKGQRVKQDGLTDVNLSANQKDIRLESTANPRLAPPRPRRSTDFVIEDSPKQMNMTNITGYIISESQQDTTDGEDNDDGVCAEFIDNEIVVNNSSADILINQRTKTEPEEGDYEHGGLVSKILQTKKEFDSVNSMNKENSKSQVNGMNEAAREREKAIFNKGINRLCNSLQTLSRSAIPLSKLMDFVQEDLETMQQEFERWRNENQMLKSQLKQEEILTQTCIEPLKAQLKELEQHAKEKERAIIKCKAKIFQNNERIQNLLFKSLEKAF
ncbi:TRAF3-interacting protein 1 [Schistosoma japonicum]|nr:TRAF3-interacting protein 1 [Schistosoma japonicum]